MQYTFREHFRLSKDIAMQGFTLYHWIEDSISGNRMGTQINTVPIESSAMALSPLTVLDDHQAQVLMTDLWNAGVRPSKELMDPVNSAHLDKEIEWLRSKVDYLIER